MKDKKIIIIILLFIILITMVIIVANSLKTQETTFQEISKSMQNDIVENNESSENNTLTLQDVSEITSSNIENLELHASYYLKEVYVEENELIEEGTKILQYTNGKYLKAPYDCYISEINIPEIEEKCLNSHYIQIQSNNILTVTMNIDETEISQISLGMEATVKVNAISNEYTGYVTHIASTANNGKFEVKIEFENDGNIKLGMTGNITMIV